MKDTDYIFETHVEKLFFDIMSKVAEAAFNDKLEGIEDSLPIAISPGPQPVYRCCIHSERAIAKERIKMMLGGDKNNNHIINVITAACDQCPMGGYTITSSCRGCLGHACIMACPKHAISIDSQHHAHIDKSKCVNCGLCARVCPFGAIYNYRRLCEKACHTGAIMMDENSAAKINYDKCISCGACMQKCPFGAIVDRSEIVDIIKHLKVNLKAREEGKPEKPFYAIMAPSMASQVTPNTVEQGIEALYKIGFTKVVEAAAGADLVAWGETKELIEKKFLTSSCCPAFVEYILKFHPELKQYVSHNLSPMAEIAKKIKEKQPDALTCFVGPCTAKKMEAQKESVSKYVDFVMTFAEARALFHGKGIPVNKLKGMPIDQATQYGRGFAKCGGLSAAVVQALKEMNMEDFKLSPLMCDGLENCIKALKQIATGDKKFNFIEGMACEGGCVGGPASLTHKGVWSKFMVDKYGKTSSKKTIKESVDLYNSKKK